MEDILDVSHRPYSPDHPLVCLDASVKQQVMKTLQPLEIEPAQLQRYGYAYERNGVSNLCTCFAPF